MNKREALAEVMADKELVRDWNHDRIITAQAQIAQAQVDMMRALHTGKVTEDVRLRMVRLLKGAADDIARLARHD